MVVDEYSDYRTTLCALIEQDGHPCTALARVEAAHAELDMFAPDVVVLELSLPGATELLETLRDRGIGVVGIAHERQPPPVPADAIVIKGCAFAEIMRAISFAHTAGQQRRAV